MFTVMSAPGTALSLERRLPLLMSALLAGALAASLFLSYGALTREAEDDARRRLAQAVEPLAASAAESMRERRQKVLGLARSAEARTVLALASETRTAGGRSGGEAPLRAAAASLHRGLGADTLLPTELRDSAGRPVLILGPSLLTAEHDEPRARTLRAADAGAANARPAAEHADTAVMGPLYPWGGRVYFWAAAPVVAGGRRLGWVVQQRRVGGPAGAQDALRGLIGEDVTIYMRNADGTVWAKAREAAGPPARRDSSARGIVHERAGLGAQLVAEVPIAGTPWITSLESSVASVHARARRTVERLAALSLLVTVLGALLSWRISRRITAPLSALTRAAAALARGDEAGRVPDSRGDEIGRLSSSFNLMAAEVTAARRELERRVVEAQAARAEAERANKAKSDFLATMSHELRTPLNAIGGYAQLLEMELYGPLTDAQKDALARLARSQAHLLGLIDDVLGFAKLDAGQVRYAMAAVPLDEAVIGVEPLVTPQLRAKGLAFSYEGCDAGITVRADREKLQQIVINLLTNAIKFTPAGGAIAVACAADDGRAYVRVRDTGVGIPAERHGTIFEPFVQGDRALNRPHEGVGLGLAIGRELARGMGGDLTVSSEPGRGSTFTLWLPREAGVPDPGPRSEINGPPSGRAAESRG